MPQNNSFGVVLCCTLKNNRAIRWWGKSSEEQFWENGGAEREGQSIQVQAGVQMGKRVVSGSVKAYLKRNWTRQN